MGRLSVFKDEHMVRAPPLRRSSRDDVVGADRPPHWDNGALPAA
jgi:hypothetical protein